MQQFDCHNNGKGHKKHAVAELIVSILSSSIVRDLSNLEN